jgi:hypothetical protein
MTVATETRDVLIPTSDLAQVSARITVSLQSAQIRVVPAGPAVLHAAWRGRPGWAHVLGWLTLPLLGLGALIWKVRRTESATITLLAERAGVRVHVTGVLPQAALASLQAGFAVPPSQSTSTAALPQAPRDHEVVASVPGFAPPARVTPQRAVVTPPTVAVEQAAGETMTSQALHQLRQRAGTAVFTLDDGQEVVVGEFGLLGRNPAAEVGDPSPQLVAVPDGTRTVSKTHLAFGSAAGQIWVMDRNSTNGTSVIAADGHRTVCEPGVRSPVRAGQTVQFGDRTLVVRGST